MAPKLDHIDHLVLTVADLTKTVRFYEDGLGMSVEEFEPADGTKRIALKFGVQKINLHVAGAEFEPKAQKATAGSADLCFITDVDLSDWQTHLHAHGTPVLEGPVRRTGATGPIISIYIRDPDGNLLEISNRT